MEDAHREKIKAMEDAHQEKIKALEDAHQKEIKAHQEKVKAMEDAHRLEPNLLPKCPTCECREYFKFSTVQCDECEEDFCDLCVYSCSNEECMNPVTYCGGCIDGFENIKRFGCGEMCCPECEVILILILVLLRTRTRYQSGTLTLTLTLSLTLILTLNERMTITIAKIAWTWRSALGKDG
jgi:hypothetical protein